ncbi:septation protein IspZ [Candidatus Pacebacteria bacterium]|nr:septation protein IspZ [Candidatus Paceibacterota bacterium]
MTRVLTYYLLAELGPVFAFFLAAQLFSFFIATAILAITTILALAATWQINHRVPVIPLISGVFVLAAGLITLIYRAPDALIFSDSLYYFLIAGLIGVCLLRKRLILKKLFGDLFSMDDVGWHVLSTRWIYICILAGILNELVRFYMSVEFWVQYKFVKLIVLTLFGFYQFTLARKYRTKERTNRWGVRKELLT